jgi:hypothetical protein
MRNPPSRGGTIAISNTWINLNLFQTPENLAQFLAMYTLAQHRDDDGSERDRLPNDMLVAGRWLYFGKWPGVSKSPCMSTLLDLFLIGTRQILTDGNQKAYSSLPIRELLQRITL